ncbi:hypothetical protein [Pseudorhodoferax sp. Leaf274]|uniref:hypothetical protein n=1 Tax=Pseudorhodoferax sp. Leaf274 TaxID=1736318 RepID=UPI000703AC7E|nr:hypothetical protein [Pseudorhodoferax sp. Leaf274]KQP45528.1 hypothetical protein ASF44_25565 [Pseudorhodoferax sp. Leaf274]
MLLSRRHCLLAIAALPAIGHAGFNFFTGEYTASHAELQALVERQFPLEQRYAEIFRVRLQEPRLGLNASTQRTGLTAALSIASPWLRGGKVDGTVAMSSALRWDAAARALRLDRPNVESLELQGLHGGDADRLRRIATVVAQELLHDHVLRSFTKEEMTVGLKTYEVSAITVLDQGIKIQLE